MVHSQLFVSETNSRAKMCSIFSLTCEVEGIHY